MRGALKMTVVSCSMVEVYGRFRDVSTRLHGAASEATVIFVLPAMRTPSLTAWSLPVLPIRTVMARSTETF
jgi:hypothetical protein